MKKMIKVICNIILRNKRSIIVPKDNINHAKNAFEEHIDEPKITEKIKKACNVMGVREGATRVEIENKYYLLAKRHLILQRENIKSEVVGLNMEKINKAYYQLIGLGSDNANDANQNDCKPQKLIPYIWENYKGTVAIAIIILIASLTLLLSKSDDRKINIVFFGEFQDDYNYIQALKDKNINNMIRIQEFLLLEDIALPYKIDMMSAAYSFVTQGDYHILIMNKKSFEEYASVANIAKLDFLAKELKLESNSCFMIQKQNVDEEEHVYGLNPRYFSNNYDLTNPESQYIIAVKDGLNSAINKTVIETVRLLLKENIF